MPVTVVVATTHNYSTRYTMSSAMLALLIHLYTIHSGVLPGKIFGMLYAFWCILEALCTNLVTSCSMLVFDFVIADIA